MTADRPILRSLVVFGTMFLLAGLVWLVFGVGERRTGLVLLPERDEDGRLRSGGSVVEVFKAAPEFTFAEALALPETAWRPWTGPGYITVERGFVAWVRVTVRDVDGEARNGVLADTSYFSDRVDAWWRDDAGSWRHAAAGNAVPGAEKPLWGRLAAFPLTVPAGGESRMIFRVADGYLPHMQPAWWPRQADYLSVLVGGVFVESICYGAMIALVFYNLVLWARLRFTDMGYYVLSAGAGAASNVIGNGGLAWLGMTSSSPGHEMLLTGLFVVSGCGMAGFTRVFLGTAELMPRVDRLLRAWLRVLVACGAGVFAMPWMSAPHWLSVVVFLVMINEVLCMSLAIVAWRRGAVHARFFVLAFAVLFLATGPAIYSLVIEEVGRGTALMLLIGRTLEMLLLSFALADRFSRTQRRLFEEIEQRHAMEEAYADELAVEVRERTRELSEANADKDRMIAVIGHDLRSPLTAITGMAEHFTRNESATAEEKARFMTEVGHLGRQVLLLIEDLVLWARLRAGTTHPTEHSLSALITPVVELHRAAAERRAVRLSVEGVVENLRVKTDLVLAQTLARNLVANALRYAKTRVVIGVVAGPDQVSLTVTDDGPGLPPEVAARLAPNADAGATDWAGQGLGLRLCSEICRALGTGLKAEAAPGGGTVFSVALKRAEAPVYV